MTSISTQVENMTYNLPLQPKKTCFARQARLNIWTELQFGVDGIIVSDLNWGNPPHDAPGLDVAFSLGSSREKGQDTLT